MGYSFRLTARVLLYAPSHRQDSTGLEREIAQWVHPMKDWSDDPSHHERTLLPQSYISLRHTFEGRKYFILGLEKCFNLCSQPVLSDTKNHGSPTLYCGSLVTILFYTTRLTKLVLINWIKTIMIPFTVCKNCCEVVSVCVYIHKHTNTNTYNT